MQPTELDERSIGSELKDGFKSGSEGRVLRYVDETRVGYDRLILSVISFKDNNWMENFKEPAIESLKQGGEIQDKTPQMEGLDCEGFIKDRDVNQQKILVCSDKNVFVLLMSQSEDGSFYDIESMMTEVWDKIKE
ncbi:MAG: hypothetical protein GOU98_00145 [Candidatus Altiarchaeota archaeon]|nr:hypothetical protein [Candidatus Altiarchaeota archaeon]